MQYRPLTPTTRINLHERPDVGRTQIAVSYPCHSGLAAFNALNQCVGLVQYSKHAEQVVCTHIVISPHEAADMITYGLINRLCLELGGLRSDQLVAQLSDWDQGVARALNVLGVRLPTRKAQSTFPPPALTA